MPTRYAMLALMLVGCSTPDWEMNLAPLQVQGPIRGVTIGPGENDRWHAPRPWPVEVRWDWNVKDRGRVVLLNDTNEVISYAGTDPQTNRMRFTGPSQLMWEFQSDTWSYARIHVDIRPLITTNLDVSLYPGFIIERSTNLVDWAPWSTTNRDGFYRLRSR